MVQLTEQWSKSVHRFGESKIITLDISKAFDSVSWSFLLEILIHLGFGPVWCNLISNLLSTASTNILINGEPGAAADGRAMDVWRRMIAAQGGDPDAPLPRPAETHVVTAPATGTLTRLDAYALDPRLNPHPAADDALQGVLP